MAFFYIADTTAPKRQSYRIIVTLHIHTYIVGLRPVLYIILYNNMYVRDARQLTRRVKIII